MSTKMDIDLGYKQYSEIFYQFCNQYDVLSETNDFYRSNIWCLVITTRKYNAELYVNLIINVINFHNMSGLTRSCILVNETEYVPVKLFFVIKSLLIFNYCSGPLVRSSGK